MDALSVLSPIGIIVFAILQATTTTAVLSQATVAAVILNWLVWCTLQEGWGVLISVLLLLLLIRRGSHHLVGKVRTLPHT